GDDEVGGNGLVNRPGRDGEGRRGRRRRVVGEGERPAGAVGDGEADCRRAEVEGVERNGGVEGDRLCGRAGGGIVNVGGGGVGVRDAGVPVGRVVPRVRAGRSLVPRLGRRGGRPGEATR